MIPGKGKKQASEEEPHHQYLHFTDEETEDWVYKAIPLRKLHLSKPLVTFTLPDPSTLGTEETTLAMQLARGQMEGDDTD